MVVTPPLPQPFLAVSWFSIGRGLERSRVAGCLSPSPLLLGRGKVLRLFFCFSATSSSLVLLYVGKFNLDRFSCTCHILITLNEELKD
ncbi:hypothetical protein BO70DRAFT_74363 [Aspergillus heteromorphus CBS 117.55]|uniref:Uncharacterized protein n=1 Tax=Aspergillus heteromorphus CBS 117.55 TaxID=1448321 RepID=A0A317VW63_9EURO|nr:uncharacterized protein BO70DRAFT_74363 [Aspergillus heteromorphus CBS 117.55]PWY77138.1 hypothetical protein BO70DRAFT_74363 [Aspergillus heteromorphus CBS 117.55]